MSRELVNRKRLREAKEQAWRDWFDTKCVFRNVPPQWHDAEGLDEIREAKEQAQAADKAWKESEWVSFPVGTRVKGDGFEGVVLNCYTAGVDMKREVCQFIRDDSGARHWAMKRDLTVVGSPANE